MKLLIGLLVTTVCIVVVNALLSTGPATAPTGSAASPGPAGPGPASVTYGTARQYAFEHAGRVV